MARSLGIPKLFKTSVKDDLNVNCVFTFLSTAYVQSVLSQSNLEEESLAIHNGHLDDTDDIDLVLNHRINAPLFGGKSNKTKSNNSAVITDTKGLLSKANGVSNKMKGKNLFKNPVILKSASTNLTNHNNQNSSSNNNRGFFSSSNKKQNNNNQQNSHQHQHYNFLKGSSNSSSNSNGAINGKSALYANGNGMVVPIGDGGGNGYVHHTHHHHQSRNGQILPPNYRHHNSYSHYVNGGGLSVDPTRWSDTNVPFRLDLVNGKKRKRDPCTIL